MTKAFQDLLNVDVAFIILDYIYTRQNDSSQSTLNSKIETLWNDSACLPLLGWMRVRAREGLIRVNFNFGSEKCRITLIAFF